MHLEKFLQEATVSEYAVIIQNDESKWDDIKGELYVTPAQRWPQAGRCIMNALGDTLP